MVEWTWGSGVVVVQLADDVEKERLKRKLERTMQQAKAKVEEVHSAYTLGVAHHTCGALPCDRAEPLTNNAAAEVQVPIASACKQLAVITGCATALICSASPECRGWVVDRGVRTLGSCSQAEVPGGGEGEGRPGSGEPGAAATLCAEVQVSTSPSPPPPPPPGGPPATTLSGVCASAARRCRPTINRKS